MLRFTGTACWTCGLGSAALTLWSTVATTTGGPTFAPLLSATGEETLPLALALVAGLLFAISAAAALVLAAAWSALRHVALGDTIPARGIVADANETWLSVGWKPIMRVCVVAETSTGPIATIALQPVTPDRLPRRGDDVDLALSRRDPSCCRIVGTLLEAAPFRTP